MTGQVRAVEHSGRLGGWPLEGITVIDVGHMVAGSMVGRVLADLGARVIKIEAPDGDYLRRHGDPDSTDAAWVPGPMYLGLNRDKESVVLDLKQPADLARMEALVRQSDVFVQNYRPGVAERLGVGAERLRELNPRLIYCAISGYGQTGPLSGNATTDGVLQGFSGLLERLAQPGEVFGPPTRITVVDLYAGTLAGTAVLAALAQRARTGVGTEVDMSLMEAAFYARMIVSQGGMLPPQTMIFECADGELLLTQTIPGIDARLFAAVRAAVPAPDGFEAAYKAAEADHTKLDAYREVAGPVFRKLTRDAWISALSAAGVPCGPVHTFAQALEHEQVLAREGAMELDVPNRGPVPLATSPFVFDGERLRSPRPPAALGADTEAVLREFGAAPASQSPGTATQPLDEAGERE